MLKKELAEAFPGTKFFINQEKVYYSKKLIIRWDNGDISPSMVELIANFYRDFSDKHSTTIAETGGKKYSFQYPNHFQFERYFRRREILDRFKKYFLEKHGNIANIYITKITSVPQFPGNIFVISTRNIAGDAPVNQKIFELFEGELANYPPPPSKKIADAIYDMKAKQGYKAELLSNVFLRK
jgi:hypothetical protein